MTESRPIPGRDFRPELILYTVPQVRAVLQRCRTSVYSDIAAGRIKTLHIRRSVRIHRDEVERIVREGLGE